ncbi:ABC transporter permease [Reichenbachiella agarivorans]|uniref:ABC transporter permease n=1 Tax=Reichenbachiella agarivorans TaxID=2979464 RepID=A0ABY6CLK3_9BACT|nr:ABC transporter permease [Reichenbachiella agarivorans]UXP31264.1 ABC transporter permease [Reichenbachiella agarivorans]
MNSLIKLEWIKNKANPTFWILMAVYIAATYVILSTGTILMNATYEFTSNQETQDFPQITIYDFPGIWHNMSYIGSFVRILLAIIVIVNISNEISYRTLRQNIIDGLSVESFLKSKLIFIVLLATVATITLFVISMYFGLTYSITQEVDTMFSNLDFIGAYFIEIFGYLCFALFITLWIKKSGMSIMFVLAYSILFEPFFGWVILGSDGWLINLLPINALDNLIQSPINLMDPDAVQETVEMGELGIALAWIIGFIGLAYFMLTKRDL